MSAWIVSRDHVNAMLTAGLYLDRPHDSYLRWLVHEPALATDDQRGDVWGPTAQESFRRRKRELTHDTADAVGTMLLIENHRSVAHRYDERGEVDVPMHVYQPYGKVMGGGAGRYRVREGAMPTVEPLEPVVILKLIDCYEYQSCEHPGWERSEALAFCRSLRSRCIGRLSGYEAAPWGL